MLETRMRPEASRAGGFESIPVLVLCRSRIIRKVFQVHSRLYHASLKSIFFISLS
jgi:hypothetical protein